jgi:hypothetical protein
VNMRRLMLAGAVAASAALAVPGTALAATSGQGAGGSTGAKVRAGPLTQCYPVAKGDYVHVSSGDASGHGWWEPGNCTASDAYVTAQLQEYISSRWENKGSAPQVHVPPGGGSGKRATGRATCSSTTLTWWRSQITVVVTQGGVGGETGSAFATTPDQEINCRV